jgi:hypothetical protein
VVFSDGLRSVSVITTQLLRHLERGTDASAGPYTNRHRDLRFARQKAEQKYSVQLHDGQSQLRLN